MDKVSKSYAESIAAGGYVAEIHAGKLADLKADLQPKPAFSFADIDEIGTQLYRTDPGSIVIDWIRKECECKE